MVRYVDPYPPYQPPTGHGVPHPPAGGQFTVVEKDLINAGSKWDEVSADLTEAVRSAQEGSGRLGLFGFADAFWNVSIEHDAFNKKVCSIAHDGATSCAQIGDGLVEVANDAAGTDQSQAANFQILP